MKEFPLVSIITPTLNASTYLPIFFQSLRKQSYPRQKLEVIVSDGGSRDATRAIARKNGARVVNNPYVQAQPGVFVGMTKARGTLLMTLPGDNIFKDSTALTTLVKTFTDKRIYAAFPKHDSHPSDSLFTKYINAFTDPFNHFVYGYAANARTFKKIYKTRIHNELYDVYDFRSYPVKPILGITQGFIVRRDILRRWKKTYDDIAPVYDLIDSNKYIAYVHAVSLYHHTVRDIKHFFRKQRWSTHNALQNREYGLVLRLPNLTKAQRVKTYLFIPYALSVIFPVIRAFVGFVQEGEILWLFHPIIAYISAQAILYELIVYSLGQKGEVSRL